MRSNSSFAIHHFAFFIPVLVLVLFAAPVAALAQDDQPNPPTDDEVNAIAEGLYCPVCENVPLDVCGTQACAQWRELIREKLSEGWSEEEIKAYFVAQYGDRVLAEPPRRGLNWLVYVIPPVAFLTGIYILYRGFQGWHQPEPEALPTEEAEIDDEYVARLEEELRRKQ